MSLFKSLFAKKEKPCCNVSIQEVKPSKESDRSNGGCCDQKEEQGASTK